MPNTRAYLRFTAGEPILASSSEILASSSREWSKYGLSQPHAVASRADLRDGTWHEADLVDYPDPETGFPDEFGLPNPARIRMAVRDRAEEGRSYKALDDEDQVESVNGIIELVKEIEQEDGTTSTFTYPRQMVITGTERREGRTELELTDRLGQALDQLYPTARYTADSHPDMIPDHEGRIIPYTVASSTYPARHVPGTIIKFDETTGETWVSFGGPGGGSLNAVYRGDSQSRALVDASEYTVANEGGEIVAKFPAKQKDSRNRWYVFSADVAGTDSNNGADELKRLLELHGMTVNAVSHSTLQSLATTWKALVTCDYGHQAAGNSGQRQVRGIVRDLLRILRCGLDFNGDGEAVFVPDQQAASSGDYVNGSPDAGPGSRRCRIHPLPRKARRKTITGQFGVSPQDPGEPAWSIERTVPTGRAPESDPTRVRYLHHPEGADRLTWYWAMLEEYNREGRLEVWDVQRAVGDVLTLTHDALWEGTREVVVRSRRPRVLGDEHRVRQYHDDIHTYVAATLPTSPGSYTKDFSGTHPDAPTDLTKDAEGVTQDNEGNYTWNGTFTATPPAENFQDIVFVAVETASGAVGGRVEGDELGGGDFQAKIGGLRTNVEYRIDCYARNAFGLKGAVTSLTLTTTTDAGNPDAPTNLSATQGAARYIEVNWDKSNAPDVVSYVLETKVTSLSTWEVHSEGLDTTRTVRIGSYTSRDFRVKAVDGSGNPSPYTPTVTEVPERNLNNPDIVAGGVHTENVEDDGVTTPKRQSNVSEVRTLGFGNGQLSTATDSISITESKAPLAVPWISSAGYVISLRGGTSSSSIPVRLANIDGTTDPPSFGAIFW